jgi:hypothetical protein
MHVGMPAAHSSPYAMMDQTMPVQKAPETNTLRAGRYCDIRGALIS